MINFPNLRRKKAQAYSNRHTGTIALSGSLMDHLKRISNEICQPLEITLKAIIESDRTMGFSHDEHIVTLIECVRSVLDDEAQGSSSRYTGTIALSGSLMDHLKLMSNEICQPLEVTLKAMIESDRATGFSDDEHILTLIECVRSVLDNEQEDVLKELPNIRQDQEATRKRREFFRDFIHTDALTEEEKCCVMSIAERDGLGIVQAFFHYLKVNKAPIQQSV